MCVSSLPVSVFFPHFILFLLTMFLDANYYCNVGDDNIVQQQLPPPLKHQPYIQPPPKRWWQQQQQTGSQDVMHLEPQV